MSRSEIDVHSKVTTTGGIGTADTLRGSGGEYALSPESLVGQRVANRYSLLQLLGYGGMGAVYLARDDELDELVALKLLRESISASPTAVEFLRREVRMARRVTHYNVARIFELGEHDGERFLTMEYIPGESLSALLHREGRLLPMRAVEILLAVCAGLQASHDAGVIHRDIKPDNVLVATSGRVVISDFGVALVGASGELERARPDSNTDRILYHSEDAVVESRVTPVTRPLGADDMLMGTPAYMAPEQIAHGVVSERSDVYSLGVMAFEMLTGELPWKYIDSARGRLRAEPPDPRAVISTLPESLCDVVVAAMASDPDRRTESSAAFGNDLARAAAELSGRITVIGGTGVLPDLGAMPNAAESAKRSVAVLPFRNRGPAEHDFIASGLTEDLIDRLSAIAELRVLSRGATARFAGDRREGHEIGRDLGVTTILEGSLEKHGDGLLVKVRAIDSRDGVQWWAERYSISPENLSTASDSIIDQVVSALAESKPDYRPSAMPSARALDAYLQARDAYCRFAPVAEQITLFEEARALAGNNPLVDAGYAMALLRSWMLHPSDPGGLVERATRAVESAMSRASHLGEPHLAAGLLGLHLGDPILAMHEIRAAIALAPSMAEAHAFLGILLSEIGLLDEAIRRLDTASRLDPTLDMPQGEHRRIAALKGDWELAYTLTGKVREPETPFGWLRTLRIAAYRGDLPFLLRIAENLELLPDDDQGMKRALLAQVAVYLGRGPAEDVYRLLVPDGPIEAISRRRLVLLHEMNAEVASFVGDTRQALDSIEQADAAGFVDLLWLQYCPLLTTIRNNERYATLWAKVQERAYTAYDAMWTGPADRE